MYNEIKIMIEKIFTTEQYVLNMKCRTPDIIDYTLRELLNYDIGESNSLISVISDKYFIISLIDGEKSAYISNQIVYKGKYAYLCFITKNIRNDDFSAKRKINIIYNITRDIIKHTIDKDIIIPIDYAASIITIDILTSLYNEHNYILDYFKDINVDEKALYDYIIHNDNATLKLLDNFELIKIISLYKFVERKRVD